MDFKDINNSIVSASGSLKDFFGSEELYDTIVNIGNAAESLEELIRDISQEVRRQMEKFFREGTNSFNSVDTLIAPGFHFPYKFEEALEEISGAARAIRILADYIERNPDSLIRGKFISKDRSNSDKKA